MATSPNSVLRNASSWIFILGITSAAAFATFLDGTALRLASSWGGELDIDGGQVPSGPTGALSWADMRDARIAWSYIEKNTRWETGFVDSIEGFPSTTLWDQGSYLMALISAHRLGIVPAHEFHDRLYLFLDGLERLELIGGALPNKVYDTRTLQMVNYENVPQPKGIGWSALDIGRLLMALRVVEKHAPIHGEQIRRILSTWEIDQMSNAGDLIGTTGPSDALEYRQEGRIGYEQYAARAAALWGLDVLRATSAERIVRWEDVAGVDVPTDIRAASQFRAITPTLSEPYILTGLELGFDAETRALAERVLQAQEARWKDTGQITIVSEDHIDQAPFFLYSSVFSNGSPWAVLTEDGRAFGDLRTQSVKATFGWDALFDLEYLEIAREEVSTAYVADRGWYAGIYELDGTLNKSLALNTNSVVLQSQHYKGFGPLWSVVGRAQVDLTPFEPVFGLRVLTGRNHRALRQ